MKLIFIWGLGIGDWGLGIGDWGLGPIPNPQSPIPNPQSPIPIYRNIFYSNFNKYLFPFLFFNIYCNILYMKINEDLFFLLLNFDLKKFYAPINP